MIIIINQRIETPSKPPQNQGGKWMKVGMELLGVAMVYPLSPPSNIQEVD